MKTIFFIHIMKTAGTSFRKMLHDSLGSSIYPTSTELSNQPNGWYLKNHQIIDAVNLGTLKLNERKVVCGHYPYILGKKIIDDPLIATFLRDPVERALSMIAHRKNRFSKYKNSSIGDMLDDDIFVKNQIENYQTKIFAIDLLEIPHINTPFRINDRYYYLALSRLKKVEFIGITEKFELSIKLFKRKTGVLLKDTLRLNIGQRMEASEMDILRIKKLVHYDLLLYKEAKAIFEYECVQYNI